MILNDKPTLCKPFQNLTNTFQKEKNRHDPYRPQSHEPHHGR